MLHKQTSQIYTYMAKTTYIADCSSMLCSGKLFGKTVSQSTLEGDHVSTELAIQWKVV